MSNDLENDYAKYSLNNRILYVIYKKEIIIDLDAAIKIVEDRMEVHKGEFLPVLCDVRGVKDIDKPARDYLASEGFELIKAIAFISEPPISTVMTEFYVKTSKPPVPLGNFERISEALLFLNSFVK